MQPEGLKRASLHPSFHKATGLDLHCDGTLQPIGYVKTAILLCKSPSMQGGELTLFNAASAFSELAIIDTPAAIALAHPKVLSRKANINGCEDINRCPTFAVQKGGLFVIIQWLKQIVGKLLMVSIKQHLSAGLTFFLLKPDLEVVTFISLS